MTRRRSKTTRKKREGGARPLQKGRARWLRLGLPIVAALFLGIGLAWALQARQRVAGSAAGGIQLASGSQLSEKVRSAPPVVQEAYRFAIANPDILAKLPCYCGCGGMGHESNLDCFIQRFDPDGSIVFGYHALE